MIRLDVVQGSDEWRAVRAGVLTTSCFAKLLTKKKLELSEQSHDYIARLVAETILGVPLDDVSSGFMERGTDLERKAVLWYEVTRDVETEVAGFLLRDDRRVGCSPDRLVGEDGGLEIKVPAAHTHCGYLIDPERLVLEYRHQVQGSLWLTGRKWWDLLSYNPELPSLVKRVEPDATYFAALDVAVPDFLARLDAAVEKVRGLVDAKNVAEVLHEAAAATSSPIEEALAAAQTPHPFQPMTADEVDAHADDLGL